MGISATVSAMVVERERKREVFEVWEFAVKGVNWDIVRRGGLYRERIQR